MFHGMETVPQDWRVKETTATLFVRMYAVAGGKVVYTDRTGSALLKAGYLYLFPTTQPYEMVQDMNSPLQCIFFHRTIAPLVVPRFIALEVQKHSFIKHLLAAVETQIPREKQAQAEQAEQADLALKIGMLVEDLGGLLVRYVNTLGLLSAVAEEMATAVRYIHGNFAQQIQVAQLAQLTGYHEKYFIRKFKEATGVSPHSYLMSCRLDAACGVLLAGNSVGRTAEICGYADGKSFSRAFKQRFGVPAGLFSRYTRPV